MKIKLSFILSALLMLSGLNISMKAEGANLEQLVNSLELETLDSDLSLLNHLSVQEKSALLKRLDMRLSKLENYFWPFKSSEVMKKLKIALDIYILKFSYNLLSNLSILYAQPAYFPECFTQALPIIGNSITNKVVIPLKQKFSFPTLPNDPAVQLIIRFFILCGVFDLGINRISDIIKISQYSTTLERLQKNKNILLDYLKDKKISN